MKIFVAKNFQKLLNLVTLITNYQLSQGQFEADTVDSGDSAGHATGLCLEVQLVAVGNPHAVDLLRVGSKEDNLN